MGKGVAVIDARMDESSGYCGCCNEIDSVSDAAKISNMVVIASGEGRYLFRKRVSSQI